MKSVDNAALRKVAGRMVWWTEPVSALRNPRLFLAQVMRYGALSDLQVVTQYFSDADFEEVLDNPPVGVFTEESWHFWHVRLNRPVVPPLPQRNLAAVKGITA